MDRYYIIIERAVVLESEDLQLSVGPVASLLYNKP